MVALRCEKRKVRKMNKNAPKKREKLEKYALSTGEKMSTLLKWCKKEKNGSSIWIYLLDFLPVEWYSSDRKPNWYTGAQM